MLPLLAFSLPVSTSGASAFALLVAFFWLVEGDFRRKWSELAANRVALAVLLYLTLHLIGLLWSEDWGDGMNLFRKQWKLLLMPVFLTAITGEHRRRVIYAFLAGLTVMMLATYLAWFDLLHYGGVTPEHPTRRLYHVVYNPMLAFGLYLVIHELIWGGHTAVQRKGLGSLALLMAFNMFITEGRAGQAAFFVLLAVLLLQYFRKRIVWGLLLAVILPPLLFATGYTLSPTFHNRIHTAWEEVAQFNYNPKTSIGFRIHFLKISWEVFRQNPLIGVGTSDFKSAYEEMNSMISPRMVATDNPHNQYFLVMCQLGVLGLAALLGMFAMQMRSAFAGEDPYRRVRLAFPLFFLLIMLSESYLIVSETGFLFSVFSAVLYKEESA